MIVKIFEASLFFLLTVLILKKPFIGLVLISILVPAEEIFVLETGRTIIWVIGILMVIAYISHLLIKRLRFQISSRVPILFLFIFLAWGIISIIWARDQNAVIERFIIIFQLVVFYILIHLLICNEKDFNIVISSYFISSILISFIAVYYAKLNIMQRTVLTESQDPNKFAVSLGMAFFLSFYLLNLVKNSIFRLFIIIADIILLTGIFVTGSRGAVIAIIITSLVYYLLNGKKRMISVVILTTISLSIIVIYLLYKTGLISYSIIERARSIIDIEVTKGGAGRINIWQVGLEMIKRNFLIGVGLGNFPARFLDYSYVETVWGNYAIYHGRASHNNIILVFSELGFIGFSMFMGFIIKILMNLKYKIKNYNSKILPFLLLLIFLIITGFTIDTLYRKFYWLGLGLISVSPFIFKKEKYKKINTT